MAKRLHSQLHSQSSNQEKDKDRIPLPRPIQSPEDRKGLAQPLKINQYQTISYVLDYVWPLPGCGHPSCLQMYPIIASVPGRIDRTYATAMKGCMLFFPLELVSPPHLASYWSSSPTVLDILGYLVCHLVQGRSRFRELGPDLKEGQKSNIMRP